MSLPSERSQTGFKEFIPNAVTLAGLCLGCLSLLLAWEGKTLESGLAILLAGVFDGLDGRIARAIGVQSELGKELDSLSDLVCFGVAPAFLMAASGVWRLGLLGFSGMFVYIACGAFRLARFNLEHSHDQTAFFSGLPIPMAGGLLASLAILKGGGNPALASPESLLGFLLVLGALMVSRVPFPSIKKASLGAFFRPRMLLAWVLLAAFGLAWPYALPFLLCLGYLFIGLGRLFLAELADRNKKARVLSFQDRPKGSASKRSKKGPPSSERKHVFKLIRLRKDEGRGA